jgi:hypothetical protein
MESEKEKALREQFIGMSAACVTATPRPRNTRNPEGSASSFGNANRPGFWNLSLDSHQRAIKSLPGEKESVDDSDRSPQSRRVCASSITTKKVDIRAASGTSLALCTQYTTRIPYSVSLFWFAV